MATQTLDQQRQLRYSVKKDDAQHISFIMPSYWYTQGVALPPMLPPETGGLEGYYRTRDRVLLAAPRYEGQWASALGIAISKMASLAWEVESDGPRLREKAQQMLLNMGAGLGIFGWVPALSMHLRSYLGIGRALLEIERATPANGSKVINVHHLNPLRCRLTGNAQKPVNYLAGDGKVRALGWHQVMILMDMPDPTEGEDGIAMAATERAYDQIKKLAAIENYVYEKVSGRRPLALYFIGGATAQRHVDDAITTSEQDVDRKGQMSYMGAVVTVLPGEPPFELITIPLAELPDGFNAVEERERADLVYANSIGLDPQDLNPSLVGRQGLGSTGNQALILADKDMGRPLAMWRQQFMHNMNELALGDKVMFTFQEVDLRDEGLKAENAKMRAETRKMQIESGEITPEQSRNLAVDEGDLPREFIQQDVTGGGKLSDTDKPEAEEPQDDQQPEPDVMAQERPAAAKEWKGLY